MMHRLLHDDWTLRTVGGPAPTEVRLAGRIPATVPGTVHTDLMAAGLIADPYLDDNERLLSWIGLTDWRYETTFDWTVDGHDEAELLFEGLDTVARVELNGHLLASTRNMHRTYRLDVREVLRAGPNTLSVTFASAIRYADQASVDLGARPHVNHHPYNAIRKMACSFGWDWGPDLVSAGIWRPVTLRSWSTARFTTVRPVVEVHGDHATVDVHAELDRSGPAQDLILTVAVGGETTSQPLAAGSRSDVVRIEVDDVKRWWPRGHGEQHLYDITVTLHTVDDPEAPLDVWADRIGFRTVRLDSSEDHHGTGFTFVINDRPVFVKGANWIPDDVFPHRVTRERYAARLAQAEEAGINLLRVWAGGIFEADDFYRECDERGLMTWQDFLFACAAYSEEEPLRSEVVAEARDNVARLMSHPSLVMWNGGNENIWGFAEWGWQARLDGRSWGMGYYVDILPAIVAELDPGRPYYASSPWSPHADRHPNDAAHGIMHIWDVWNHADYTVYRDYRPRFVAEFGWQGPPAWSTLRRAVSDAPLTPESPGMLVHQKAADGNTKLSGGLVPHLPIPDSMEDWHWAMSLNQARAVRTGVEYFRSLGPLCSGSVVWQLNDCWPVVSWAAVDGDGRRKPMFYALRHAHADRLVTVQPHEGGLHVALINDTDRTWAGPLRVSRSTFDGRSLATVEIATDVAPWTTVSLALPSQICDAGPAEVLVANLTGERATWFFAEDRTYGLPAPRFDAAAVATDSGYRVTITAISLLRDLGLLADKLDPGAVVDDMLVTLLPGETVTWQVTSDAPLDPDDLLAHHILRSANQLVHPADAGGSAPASVLGAPRAYAMDPT